MTVSDDLDAALTEMREATRAITEAAARRDDAEAELEVAETQFRDTRARYNEARDALMIAAVTE